MLNKVMVIGRLGADPELRHAGNGTPIANFNMATDESYTDKEGQKHEKTEWHRIVVMGRMAENCANYLGKGSLVYIEGSLQTRQWQDQQGQTRYITEVKAHRVQFLNRRGEGQQSGNRGGGRQNQAVNQSQDENDLGSAFPSESFGLDDVPFS